MLNYEPTPFTVAVHARRGDIVNSINARTRWTPNDVYATVLSNLLEVISEHPQILAGMPIVVHIFSEGAQVRAGFRLLRAGRCFRYLKPPSDPQSRPCTRGARRV